MQNRAIRPSDLVNELRANALADVPSMIWGPPGVGKSDIAYQFGESMDAKMYELRANLFDPIDVRGGLKVVEMDDGTYCTRYGVPEDYPDSNYQGAVLLFIDEIVNAPKATQKRAASVVCSTRRSARTSYRPTQSSSLLVTVLKTVRQFTRCHQRYAVVSHTTQSKLTSMTGSSGQ